MASTNEQRPGIRPRTTLGRRLDIGARHAFPASITVLLMLLSQVPFGIASQAALLPALTLSSVWFWSLYRPAAMAPSVTFAIGVLFDLLGWLPIGVGVLALLLVHGLSQRWRRVLVRLGFVWVWIAFAAIGAGAAGLEWTLSMLLTWRLLPLGPILFQAILTTAVYPTMAILFARAHRSVADPERS